MGAWQAWSMDKAAYHKSNNVVDFLAGMYASILTLDGGVSSNNPCASDSTIRDESDRPNRIGIIHSLKFLVTSMVTYSITSPTQWPLGTCVIDAKDMSYEYMSVDLRQCQIKTKMNVFFW